MSAVCSCFSSQSSGRSDTDHEIDRDVLFGVAHQSSMSLTARILTLGVTHAKRVLDHIKARDTSLSNFQSSSFPRLGLPAPIKNPSFHAITTSIGRWHDV